MTILKKTTALSTLALALAACGDDVAEDPVVGSEMADVETAATAEYDPMTRDYALSDDAQTRRDAFDADAFRSEYDGYRDEVAAEQVANADEAATAADMSEDERSEMEAASQERDADTNMRRRQNMTWGYLDRNDDDQLSVAEYAIWAVPANPNTPVENDQTKPYISTDQINEAGKTFFYFDEDGNTYLSDGEFTAARNSARTPGGSSM